MGQLLWSSKAYELCGDGSRIDLLPKSSNSSLTSDDGSPTVIPDWKDYESHVITEEDGRTPVAIRGKADYREQLARRGLECVDSGKPYVSPRESRRRKSKRFFT